MRNLWGYTKLQFKLDIRNKNVLLPFYVIPLVFYLVMGFVFTSIIPGIEETLISSMIIFGVVIGTSLGQTIPINEIYGSDIIKSYKMGNIPLKAPLIVNVITSALHVTIVSAIIFVTCPFFFKASFPSAIGNFIVAYVLLLFASLGIGALIGTSFKSTSGLVMAGQIVFLPSIMLAGIMFPTDLLPEALQIISFVFPASLGNKLMVEANLNPIYIVALLGISIITYFLATMQIKKRV